MSNISTITYNGSIIAETEEEGNVIVVYDGRTIADIGAGETKTLTCANKVMNTNLTVGSKTLLCKLKEMMTNVTIDVVPSVPPVAYAVYSADDSSLTFYKTSDTITAGQPYRGKTATAVYTGFEEAYYEMGLGDICDTPWFDYSYSITSVTVADEGITPVSTSYWFCFFENCISMDLAKLDTSNVTSMQEMFGYCRALTELDLSNFNTQNVTNMNSMFNQCLVQSIAFPENFGAAATNMSSMFRDSSLYELDLSNFNTSNVKYMGYMFYGNYMTELDLSNFNTTNVTDMSQMFYYCTKLQSITFGPNWNTSNVTDMYAMFNNCSKLIADCYEWNVDKVTDHTDFNYNAPGVILPRPWQPKTAYAVYSADDSSLTFYNTPDTITEGQPYNGKAATNVWTGFEDGSSPWSGKASSITSVLVADEGITPESTASWFYDFTSCTGMDLAKLDTSNVTSMEYMFQGCEALESITFGPNWNTSNVTDMYHMFGGCEALTQLDLSNFNTQNVANMNGMFSRCSALESITFGPNWNTSNVTVMSFMFEYCSALTVDCYNWNVDKVMIHTDFNYNAPGVNLPKPWGGIPLVAYAVYSADDYSFTFYKTSDTITERQSYRGKTATKVWTGFENGSSPWQHYSNTKFITSVTVADAGIAPTSTASWFNGFAKCTSMDLAKLDTSNVTDMKSMFYSCRVLKSITFSPNWNTQNVTNMSFMFCYCDALQSITFGPNWNTSNVTDMQYMFWNCVALESITFPENFGSAATTMQYMFSGCSALTSLDLSGFNTQNVTTMYRMFENCEALTSVGDISGWNTSNVTDMGEMFDQCEALAELDLSGWNTQNVTTMYRMFWYCEALTADCSGWNVDKVTKHSGFNTSAPGVIAPAWVA